MKSSRWPNKKEKRWSLLNRIKVDVLTVKASDKTTHAAFLRKMWKDPCLKELGKNVVQETAHAERRPSLRLGLGVSEIGVQVMAKIGLQWGPSIITVER